MKQSLDTQAWFCEKKDSGNFRGGISAVVGECVGVGDRHLRDLCSGVDGTGGALAFTSTAVDASVGVDVVLGSTLGDGLGGAYCCTSAAGDAGVFDYVSHCLNLV